MFEEEAPIAKISEQMEFITEEEVSSSVLEKWNFLKHSKTSIIVGGEIMHYQRKVEVRTQQAKKMFNRFEGVVDIQRFHVWHWIRTLSDPKKEVFFLDEEGDVQSRMVKRLYEVDVMIRYQEDGKEDWGIFTIKLDRRGIVDVVELD